MSQKIDNNFRTLTPAQATRLQAQDPEAVVVERAGQPALDLEASIYENSTRSRFYGALGTVELRAAQALCLISPILVGSTGMPQWLGVFGVAGGLDLAARCSKSLSQSDAADADLYRAIAAGNSTVKDILGE